MELALKIKYYRTINNLSQAKLGELLNVTQQAVGKWEKSLSEPDSTALNKMADLFKITVDELLGREEKNLIERPPYEVTDKPLVDLMKLFEIMTEIQKAQVLGFAIGLLEQAGVNVKSVLG